MPRSNIKTGPDKAHADATTAHGARPAVLSGGAAADDSHFDRLVYERVRLGMMSALAVREELTFSELKALFAVSDGNLSAHARKLEEAGYVTCTKSFAERRPRSAYRLTTVGRAALNRYLDHVEAVIKATRRV
jgi:DNA-binding MarR family transcriptional regulator